MPLTLISSRRFAEHQPPPGHPERSERAQVMNAVADRWRANGGEVVAPLPMQSGKAARYDYEYEREGTACMLVAFEPLTGKRLVETSKRRTKLDYSRFQQRVVEAWPKAEKIVLVQDNLNTHNARTALMV